MSFLGQATRKRAINLGNKQQTSRNDVLKKAQEDRLARERSRAQVNAALIVQKAGRTAIRRRRARRLLMHAFESTHYSDPLALLADFIAAAPALDAASDPQRCIGRALEALPASPFLHTRLLSALNSSWMFNSPAIPFILPLYGANLPSDIIEPLHSYATAHPGSYYAFFQHLFNMLAPLYPNEVLHCVLKQDTLITLGVDLGRIVSAHPIDLVVDTPKPRIMHLLSECLQNLEDCVPLVVKLVSAIRKLSRDDVEMLAPLFTRAFLGRVQQLALAPAQLAEFLLPLLHSRAKNDLLLQLTLARTNFVQQLWTAFKATPSFAQTEKLVDAVVLDPPNAESPDWRLFIVMLEVYSYYLIVCNDSTLFDVLDHSEVVVIAQTLRTVCFLSSWMRWLPPHGGIFFVVIRQLHTRNARRPFLTPNFWHINKFMPVTSIHVDTMLNEISYQEASLGASDDDDEDEEEVVVRASPTVEILRQTPFFIDFMTRVLLFLRFAAADRAIHQPPPAMFWGAVEMFEINRESVVEDTAVAFAELAPDAGLKTKFKVQMLSNGEPELGIDGGGLTKEVLTSVCQQVFVEKSSVEYSDLFLESADHTLYPNPRYSHRQDAAERYQFLGAVVGKCLYDNLLVDVTFSPVFLRKWSGTNAVKSSFDDIYLLDPELYDNLLKLLSYDAQTVEDLALDFTTEDEDGVLVELRPGGANIAVTALNRLEYIHALSNYKINTTMNFQTKWFLRGVSYFILPSWLKMFSPREIQMLISGQSSDISVEDLRRHTQVNGFAQDVYVDNFWQVVQEMNPQERRALLKFVTSVPRGPLRGFAELSPKFGLRSAGRDDERLPTASTCVNLLKLPEYSSKELLRQKLLYSINSNAGFDLS